MQCNKLKFNQVYKMDTSNEYYKFFGLSNSSSSIDIKKTFKKLALKYHPDKNNGNDDLFKYLLEAYEYLLNHVNHKTKTDEVNIDDLKDKTIIKIHIKNTKSTLYLSTYINETCKNNPNEKYYLVPLQHSHNSCGWGENANYWYQFVDINVIQTLQFTKLTKWKDMFTKSSNFKNLYIPRSHYLSDKIIKWIKSFKLKYTERFNSILPLFTVNDNSLQNKIKHPITFNSSTDYGHKQKMPKLSYNLSDGDNSYYLNIISEIDEIIYMLPVQYRMNGPGYGSWCYFTYIPILEVYVDNFIWYILSFPNKESFKILFETPSNFKNVRVPKYNFDYNSSDNKRYNDTFTIMNLINDEFIHLFYNLPN